jgi:hypothetical protein
MNELLKQFIDSSIAVSEQIDSMIQEIERLKKRVSELEQSGSEPEIPAKPLAEAVLDTSDVHNWMTDNWPSCAGMGIEKNAETELRELRIMADAFWLWLSDRTDEALKPVCDAFWKYKIKGIENAE